ncbi:MAG: thiamine diphosphokinase [Lachnospiraceae bacterium]|nr:thiamine diphosphokinase [Lachnospiraceae bacterium]
MGKSGKSQGILVGSAPVGKEGQLLKRLLEVENVYSVAVDGGIGFFVKNHLKPAYWLGDMDSVSEDEMKAISLLGLQENCICKVPAIKDDTDMALAVDKALEAGCEEILIFGGTGGQRISHTIANIQLMQAYAKKGCHIMMVSEGCRMEVLHRGIKAFSKEMKGLISVFSLTDVAERVEIEGLKYEYKGNLSNDRALGVSNAFIGNEGRISIGGEGCLLLVYESDETGETAGE